MEIIETAILGGTFDPIHKGHLALAYDLLEREVVQEVMFVPSARPPHKVDKKISSAKHRLAMLDLAIAEEARFSISDYEIVNNYRESYTVHTLNALKTAMPSRRFKLVIGMDNLEIFHTWYEYKEILRKFPVLTYGRPGYKNQALAKLLERFNGKEAPHLVRGLIEDGPVNDISSTEIRQAVRDGKDLDEYLLPSIAEYIKEKGLYND